MRVAAPALCVALLLGGAAGCAAGPPTTMSETVEAEVLAFEDALEGLSGVADATLSASVSGAQIHLSVELDDDATTGEIEAAGLQANTLRQAEFPHGIYPGQIELRLGASVYTYFTLPTEDALRSQLGYWSQLAHTGTSSVTFRTFTAPLSAPPTDAPMPASTTGAPVLLNAPTGRYVGISMPGGDAEAARPVLEAIRVLDDPGASVGEWHLISEDGRVKAEFAGPTLPEQGDIDSAISLLSSVDDLGADATLGLRIDRENGEPKIDARLTAFDSALEGAHSDTVEEHLRETPIWDAVLQLVDTLESTGLEFSISLLSNAVDGAGNFVFGVSVSGCEFVPDAAWTSLSAELAGHWQTVHEAREPGACATAA